MIQTFSANLSSEPDGTGALKPTESAIEGVWKLRTFGSFDSKHGQDQSFAFPNSYIMSTSY